MFQEENKIRTQIKLCPLIDSIAEKNTVIETDTRLTFR